MLLPITATMGSERTANRLLIASFMRRIVFKGMKATSFALQKRESPKVFGYLHNSDNSCTGLSLRSQFLSTLKLPLGKIS